MGAATLAHWSDGEHQLLVRVTNAQTELECRGQPQEISRAAHWRRVAARLLDRGYSRTDTACRGHWKRVEAAQEATEAPAESGWDEQEDGGFWWPQRRASWPGKKATPRRSSPGRGIGRPSPSAWRREAITDRPMRPMRDIPRISYAEDEGEEMEGEGGDENMDVQLESPPDAGTGAFSCDPGLDSEPESVKGLQPGTRDLDSASTGSRGEAHDGGEQKEERERQNQEVQAGGCLG
ncbi:unnamed protein product [Diplocarpon coronariae]|uniref:Myb-like domain-containing protein n=1 Tax=Diplocarpon coronariae TaxID=2795749 RepID=A0A218Z0I5_9HELO|nr:hypothetical protein B2J93_2097 [Marssonina coronariae]